MDLPKWSEEEREQHFQMMREKLRVRLVELGIEEQLPNLGIFKLTYQIVVTYWREEKERLEAEEAAEAVGKLKVSFAKHQGDLPGARDIVLTDADGDELILGVVYDGELYVEGHILSVEQGVLRGRHEDGVTCNPGCPSCHKIGLLLTKVDGFSYYVHCAECGEHTGLYADAWLAVGAVLAGITKEREEVDVED